jgi:hypothetical protein
MAMFILCQTHLGTPRNDRFSNGLQAAIDCPQCIVIDSGADD